HYVAAKGHFGQATGYIAITLALGAVFLVIKAYEYNAKYQHDILPGHVGEVLPGMSTEREKEYHPVGMQYVEPVRLQLDGITKGVTEENLSGQSDLVRECYELRQKMNAGKDEKGDYKSPLSPAGVGKEVNEILEKAEKKGESLHLTPTIPFGNLWASCYFAM